MGPQNYNMQVLDPIAMALQGYASKVAQDQAARQMDQQDVSLGQGQQRLDMAQQAMMFEQQQAQAAQQQAAQAQAQAQAGQQAYVDYMFDPNKTAAKTEAVIRANPVLADAIMGVWQGMAEEQKTNTKQFGMQFVYALKSGNEDAAKGLLKDRIAAAENAGNMPEADAYRAELMQLDAGGADSVLADAMVTLYGGMGPKEFDEFSATLPGQAPEEPDSVTALRIRAQEAGLVEGSPEYQEFMSQGGAKPGPQTVIDMGGGTDKQVFDAMAAENATVRSVITGYNALSEAKKAVDSGIISGFGADNILAFQKLGAALGIADPEKIQNTETFRSAIAPQIAAMIKATVGSAQLSNADREFAEKAAGGNITLDDGSIKRLLGIMEKASRASIDSYQKRLDEVYPDTPEFARERALFGINAPPPIEDNAARMDALREKMMKGEKPTPEEAAWYKAFREGGQ